jgi:hypothetical protein
MGGERGDFSSSVSGQVRGESEPSLWGVVERKRHREMLIGGKGRSRGTYPK